MRLPVFDRRRAGVLLPMSALEAALGRGGRACIDWLAEAGFSVWQILPAGPVGEDRSPYWVRSDCAGNPAFLDPAELPDPAGPVDPEFLAGSAGGVPPGYFAPVGQLGGNPVYDWQALKRTGFAWWLARVRAQLARMDLLRIDHFRALAAYWAVPAGARDARGGAWQHTPGEELLRRILDEFSDLPLVAEDLGLITEDVRALTNGFGLPGMRVLQFAFDGEPDNPHLPYLYDRDCVAYSGTHDNDTTLGWYRSLDRDTAQRGDYFLPATAEAMPEALIRAALASVARLAVIPAQDLLGLDSAARLNTPGTVAGNWTWRLPPGALTTELAQHYRRLNGAFGRAPG